MHRKRTSGEEWEGAMIFMCFSFWNIICYRAPVIAYFIVTALFVVFYCLHVSFDIALIFLHPQLSRCLV